MTSLPNPLLAENVIDDEIATVLQACFQGCMSLNVCGGSASAYTTILQGLLAMAPQEYGLVLLASGTKFSSDHGGVSVHANDEVSGTDFARSAVRQDPDFLALDQRAAEALPMLLNAKMTGHRLLVHLDATPQRALELYGGALETLVGGAEAASGLLPQALVHDLFLSLADGDEPELLEISQACLDDSGALRIVRLFSKEEGEWQAHSAFSTPRPTAPREEDFTPIPIPEHWEPRTESLLDELRQRLGGQRRRAWAPVLGTSAEAAGSSKFGGAPQLGDGETWPCCGACGQRMLTIIEIDLASSPQPFQQALGEAAGVFQLFYCVSDTCSVQAAWEPFQPNSLARVLSAPATTSIAGELSPAPELERYGTAPIVAWTALEEGPSSEERHSVWPNAEETLGWSLTQTLVDLAEASPERAEKLQQRHGPELAHFRIGEDDLAEILSYLGTATGDKLMGWPWWSQGAEYPCCPECSQPMTMILQINNDGSGPDRPGCGSFFGQVFAGDGNGHVFRCPDHGQMTFAWACG